MKKGNKNKAPNQIKIDITIKIAENLMVSSQNSMKLWYSKLLKVLIPVSLLIIDVLVKWLSHHLP
jgi:hypothetical protein